jgi:hypothetical protein
VGCVNPAGASRGRAVLVNEPTESIRAENPERSRGSGEAESRSRLWRQESQATMRTMAVVMIDVGVQDALELATIDDQDPVEALAPHGADEALGKRVRLRSLDRCSDDLDPLAAKDLVEGAAELRVAIVDLEAGGEARSASDHESWRACWATQASLGCWVQPATCTLRLPSSMKKT